MKRSGRRWLELLVAGAALSACATIPSGAGGVLWSSGNGVQPEPLGEGEHFVGPLSSVTVYDLRAQEHDEDLVGLTADGALVAAGASVVTYHLLAEELPALDRELGPDYYPRIISPLVRSAARLVLAGFHIAELDTVGIRRAQAEMTSLLGGRLRPLHIVLDGVALRRVTPLSPVAYQAVLGVGALEQQALSGPALLELARRRADGRREAARGIAAGHSIVAPTLTRQSLDESFNRAWGRLLGAPTTNVIIRPSGESPLLLEVAP